MPCLDVDRIFVLEFCHSGCVLGFRSGSSTRACLDVACSGALDTNDYSFYAHGRLFRLKYANTKCMAWWVRWVVDRS